MRWNERQGVTEEKECVVTLYWTIRKDLAKKVTADRDVKCMSELISYPGKNIPGRGNS